MMSSVWPLSVVLVLSNIIQIGAKIPSTLDGPFKPVTVPFDANLRFNAIDLPDTDPRVRRKVKGFEPEQISVSLSASYDSVWISWVTGEFQIGSNIKPLDPKTVASVVRYGALRFPLTHEAQGHALIYNQLYPFEGLQNYTSGIIHHVRLTSSLGKLSKLGFLLSSPPNPLSQLLPEYSTFSFCKNGRNLASPVEETEEDSRCKNIEGNGPVKM